MAKEQFFHAATQPLFKKLEQLSHRSSVSRGQAFEDWLTAMVCALAAETKEDEYLAMVERHKAGIKGQRGIDLMGQMFGDLINAISREDNDLLGDLFQGSVSYGENSLYVTPAAVASLMARLSLGNEVREDDEPPTIYDPCCGTGVLLMEAGKISPRSELVGQDIDARCAKITAINLGLRSHYGWVMCGNTLSGETRFVYRVGSFFHESPNGLRRGVIRDVSPESTPIPLIANRTKSAAQDLLAERGDCEETSELALPKIIEIPEWLSRLEPKSAALERAEGDAVPEQQPNQTVPETKSPQQKQRELF